MEIGFVRERKTADVEKHTAVNYKFAPWTRPRVIVRDRDDAYVEWKRPASSGISLLPKGFADFWWKAGPGRDKL